MYSYIHEWESGCDPQLDHYEQSPVSFLAAVKTKIRAHAQHPQKHHNDSNHATVCN